MNFSNHYRQLNDDCFMQIVNTQVDYSAFFLGEYGCVTLRELNDLSNMLLMGAEIAR